MQSFQPNWYSPPGETINELICSKRIDISDFCKASNLTEGDYSKLIKGALNIDSKIANHLETILSIPKEFWLNREEGYRKSLNRQAEECTSWLEQ